MKFVIKILMLESNLNYNYKALIIRISVTMRDCLLLTVVVLFGLITQIVKYL